jgi:hypothetical protein
MIETASVRTKPRSPSISWFVLSQKRTPVVKVADWAEMARPISFFEASNGVHHDCERRLRVFTGRPMMETFDREDAFGRFPRSIERMVVDLPYELQMRLNAARAVAPSEVSSGNASA